MVEGLLRIPLRRFEDERGWFCELRRESLLPKPTLQTNVSFSRRGVVRGLHFHERGQDDLFACLQGTARVVVLDRDTGRVGFVGAKPLGNPTDHRRFTDPTRPIY